MKRKALPRDWTEYVQSGVLHAISLATTAMVNVHGWAANCVNPRLRLQAELEEAQRQMALLKEELRIKHARMASLPARKRPHFSPVERMAILELRAARGWSLAETARHFLVEPETIASWIKQLDEKGEKAFVQLSEPVNKFPDFVGYLIRRLKTLCPMMGRKRMAQTLARAGLHLSATTIGRMLRQSPLNPDSFPDDRKKKASASEIVARHPDHIWQSDLTVVPTRLGFWVAWFPFSQLQRWPFCWWVMIVKDVFTRQIMGTTVFPQQPSSSQVQLFLDRLMWRTGRKPKSIISDKGSQFWNPDFKEWCRYRKIKPRYGAVGRYGSIALVERLILSVKSENLWKITVPLKKSAMEDVLEIYTAWFNRHRPHQGLGGLTPMEIAQNAPPIYKRPRFETRKNYPLNPSILLRGNQGDPLELLVVPFKKNPLLPIIQLKKAA